jgi:RNA polymerase sigma-70 factor (ECF subfamily)
MSSESIWRDFSADVHTYIARRVKNVDDTDDILQDVFMKIHTNVDQLDDASRVAPWVYRIARNTIVDFYRRRAARPNADTDAVDGVAVEPEPEAGPNLDAWMRGAIRELPEKYRDAVTLTELEGITQVEVAKRLGLSVSGAKSRVQRGRAMIKEMLLACCHLEFDRRGNLLDYHRRDDCRLCSPGCDDTC